jgi:uncharacterized protein (DUF58 family)
VQAATPPRTADAADPARAISRRPYPGAPLPAPLPALDMQLLAELPSLELQARFLVQGFLSGLHRSPQKGSSVEFAEYRNYQLGDDPRRVDWRLYGRTDRLHVRQFEEETQLRIFFVIDTSSSMDFRSGGATLRKLELARVALAGLGLIAQRQRDAFGLAVAGAELDDFLPARSSTAHWRRCVGRMESLPVGGRTALAATLTALAELLPSRSMVVIASDFYEEMEPLRSALRRLRYDRHELIGLHVLDPLEVDFDTADNGTFIDAETGGRLRLDPEAVRRGYLARFNAFCTELDQCFHEAGGEVARLRSDQPPVAALTAYLAQREERL